MLSTDVVLQKTPYVWDVSVFELTWPLAVGAALEVPHPNAHKELGQLNHVIRSCGVRTIHFVPSMFDVFLEWQQHHSGEAGMRIPSLCRIFCSGEALTSSACRACFEILPHVQLYDLYGPTEATVEVI